MTESDVAPPKPSNPTRDVGADENRSGLPAFAAGAVLLVGAGVFAWSLLSTGGGEGGATGSTAGAGQERGGEVTKTAVRVHDVEVGSLKRERRVPGELFVTRQSVLRARAGGEVTKAPYRLGAVVEANALLVQLDTGSLPAELARAEALVRGSQARLTRTQLLVEQAARELTRREGLHEQRAVSRAEVERAHDDVQLAETDLQLAHSEVEKAQADADILRVRLSERRVSAPFRGRVARRELEVGSMVNAGDEVMTLVADDVPSVRFSVAEQEAVLLKIGATVQVRFHGTRLEGRVSAIGAAVDVQSRTLPVEAELLLPAGKAAALLPGSFVEVEVALGDSGESTVVPVEALLGDGPLRHLFIIQDGTARQIETRVILEDGERAAVEGVEVGQRVVVSGSDNLKDGASVEVVR